MKTYRILRRSIPVLVIGLLLSLPAVAMNVTVDDVVGNPGDLVTVSLFVDGFKLSPTGDFDLTATLDFDPELTIDSVSAATNGPALPGDGLWTFKGPAVNEVSFISAFKSNPAPFFNTEMMQITFAIGAGTGLGPFSIGVSSFIHNAAAAVIPLPGALWLLGTALVGGSFCRRRA